MNKVIAFLGANKKIFIACFFALLLYMVYQFYPQINQIIGFGMMWTIGRLFPAGSMWLIMIAPWIVAGLLSAAITIIHWLARDKESYISSYRRLFVKLCVCFILSCIYRAAS